jgi:hypothetical protein
LNRELAFYRIEPSDKRRDWNNVKHFLDDYLLNSDDYYTENDGVYSFSDSRSDIFFVLLSTLNFSDSICSGMAYGIDRPHYGGFGLTKPEGYDNRFYEHAHYAVKLSKNNFSVFSSQTGYGKTMLGILYLLHNGRKGYWVCPRNSICKAVYNNILNELDALGWRGRVNVGLLLANKWKDISLDPETSGKDFDIVVTNIDSFLNPSISTGTRYRSYDMVYSSCIFDEFHEYVTGSELMGLFKLVCDARHRLVSKTLLMSAVDVPLFYPYNNVLRIKHNCDRITGRKIRMRFDEDRDINHAGGDYLVCSRSVRECVGIYENDETDNVLHSRYTDSDVSLKLDELYRTHGKGCPGDMSWSTTNMITTGVDCSFHGLSMSYPTFVSLLEALGRVNRWGECEAVPDVVLSMDEGNKSEKYGADAMENAGVAKETYNILKETFEDGREVTLGELYGMWEKYSGESAVFKRYFDRCLAESCGRLLDRKYAYSYNGGKGADKKYISRNSIRSKGETQFFARFKDGATGDYMDDVVCVDGRNVRITVDMFGTIVNDIYKRGEEKKYFGRRKRDAVDKMAGDPGFLKRLVSMACCSDTPVLIPDGYAYDKGLHGIGWYRL